MSPRPLAAGKLSEVAPVFAALGDATRLRIVARLCDGGPQPTVRFTKGASLTRQGITKHLRALEDAGLVRSGHVGRECIWRLQPNRLTEVRRYLEQISSEWDRSLERLRASVEDP